MGYYLMVPLIFLNLFIAIILEGYEQTSTKVGNLIQEDEIEKFRMIWSTFDKNVSINLRNFYSIGYGYDKDIRFARFDATSW